MLRLKSAVILCFFCGTTLAQNSESDSALLKKARDSYDAPFTRNLTSFDCAVQFDWKKHLAEFMRTIPPAALPTVEQLQRVPHRIFADRSGATVSAQPKAPDFGGDQKAAQLEQVFNTMTTQGLNAWLPFSTNVVLPVGPTKYNFEKSDAGYKLVMNGANVAATILLDGDLRITSGVVQLPQDLRFTTQFGAGPNGYLLTSVRTGSTAGSTDGDATFAYTYQAVDGVEIPSEVTVSPATTEPWHYALTDCKVVRFFTVQVGPPPVAH